MNNLSNDRQGATEFHERFSRRAVDRRCTTVDCPTCRPNNHPSQLQFPFDGLVVFAARPACETIDIGSPPTPRDVLIDYLRSLGIDDSEEVARMLFREFESISHLLGASLRRLRRAVGRKVASSIQASRKLMLSALEEPITARPLIAGRKDLHQYLRLRLGHAPRECLLAFFLDSGLRLIRIDRIARGSIADAKLDVAKIIMRGADLGAAAFLLVHNHPSGDPRPSPSDIRATARVGWIFKELDLPLIDHLIVAGGEVRSVCP